MSTDFEDKEREFLETLKADTGRDLGEWMEEISNQDLPHRNDVIDWLRQQGFIFSRASWLERIHANDGRPIYLSAVPDSLPVSSVRTWTREGMSSLDATASRPPSSASGDEAQPGNPGNPAPPQPLRPTSGRPFLSIVRSETKTDHSGKAAAGEPLKPAVSGTGQPKGPAATPQMTAAQMPGAGAMIASPDQAALSATIARAKAYAPLTGFLLRRIAGSLPEAIAVAARDHITLHAGDAARAPFAVLSFSARELRLALAGLETSDGGPLVAGRLTGAAQGKARDIAVYVALTDARQLDDQLNALIVRSYSLSSR